LTSIILNILEKQNMHTTNSWSIKVVLVLKPYFYFFVLQSFNSQAHTPMTTPPILQKGDTIAILATARKNIDDNLQPAIDLLHSWGLEVVIETNWIRRQSISG
jgi:muramoyltetrapeptide carboxypeptidase